MEKGKNKESRNRDNNNQTQAVDSVNNGEDVWEGYADVIRHITTIHNDDIRSQMGNDMLLFRSDPLLSDFIIKQVRVADGIYEFIQEKQYAKKSRDRILKDILVMINLRRNDPTNWILKTITERSLREHGEEEEKGVKQKLLQRLGAGGSPQVIEVED